MQVDGELKPHINIPITITKHTSLTVIHPTSASHCTSPNQSIPYKQVSRSQSVGLCLDKGRVQSFKLGNKLNFDMFKVLPSCFQNCHLTLSHQSSETNSFTKAFYT